MAEYAFSGVALAPLLALGVMAGLAALLLALDPNRRATRVFALFLLGRAVLNGANGIRTLALDPGVDALWTRVTPYFVLPLLPLLALFVLVYPRPRVARPGIAVAGAVLVTLILEALYLWDHALYATWTYPDGGVFITNVGPLYLLLNLTLPAYALAAVVFVRDHLREPAGGVRASLLLVSVGLLLDVAFLGVLTLLRGTLGILPPSVGDTNDLLVAGIFLPWSLALVPVAVASAMLARAAATERGEARARRRALLALGGAALTAVVTAAAYAASPPLGLLLHATFDGLWTLAQPALIAYALLRHRLFDLDLRVKRSLRDGTVVAAFAGVLLLTREGAGALLPRELAMVLAVAATASLVLVLRRLQGLGERVAEAALPGAEDEVRLSARKVEVYRAALEEAVLAGRLDAEEPRLAALRRELGLTARDHAVLAFAVQGHAVAPSLGPGDTVLGRWRLERVLGEGANGTTFLAADADGGPDVAAKVLRPDRGEDAATLREARALEAVRHPHVVRLLASGQERGRTVLVMEHVPGGSLAARLRRGRLDEAGFRRLADGLLGGLAAVHAAGVVHRDVKPSNVLLTADGAPKLGDFGIAHLPGLETTVGGGRDPGTAVGTIRFMSPEQARGRRVTPRSDLFSAGATLYEAWTGRPYLAPLPGESSVELQMRAAAGQAFPRDVPGPPAIRAWFARALHPDPSQRFASAEDAAEHLAQAFRR